MAYSNPYLNISIYSMENIIKTLFQLTGTDPDLIDAMAQKKGCTEESIIYGQELVANADTANYLPEFFWLLIVFPIFFAILFYNVIDRPKFNKWYIWSLFGGISSLLYAAWTWFRADNFLTLVYKSCKGGLDNPDIQIEIDALKEGIFMLSISAFIWSFILYILVSQFTRLMSNNCRTTPLPH